MSDALTLEVALGKATFSASGLSEHVLQAFADFQSLLTVPISDSLLSSDTAPVTLERLAEDIPPVQEPTPLSAPVSSGPAKAERVPLPIFLSSKALKGNNTIALGVAIWAKRHEGMESVDAETVKSLWRGTRYKLPANLPRDLSNAVSAGWLERVDKAYFVTGHGEEHFDNLPRPDL